METDRTFGLSWSELPRLALERTPPTRPGTDHGYLLTVIHRQHSQNLRKFKRLKLVTRNPMESILLNGLRHAQVCLHLFSDSERYRDKLAKY